MHFAVASCMRNEAIFILEWIAHQRLCGFRTIIVVTNDCTDGTDTICDEIAAVDPNFVHVRNELGEGETPQISGMAKVLKLPVMAEVDYLLHCESDEFLNVDIGAGRVKDLLAMTGEHDCIALAWRPFGDAGNKTWTGGLVMEQCMYSAGKLRPSFAVHKSLFRPSRFGRATDHMPKEPTSHDVTAVNTKGEALPTASLFHPRHARYRGTPRHLFTWDNACIFHYAIRSEDVFLMKNKRGDGMGRKTVRYQLNSKFWRRNNKNTMRISMRHGQLEKIKHLIGDLRQIGQTRAIEKQALQNFARESRAYLTPEKVRSLTIPETT